MGEAMDGPSRSDFARLRTTRDKGSDPHMCSIGVQNCLTQIAPANWMPGLIDQDIEYFRKLLTELQDSLTGAQGSSYDTLVREQIVRVEATIKLLEAQKKDTPS